MHTFTHNQFLCSAPKLSSAARIILEHSCGHRPGSPEPIQGIVSTGKGNIPSILGSHKPIITNVPNNVKTKPPLRPLWYSQCRLKLEPKDQLQHLPLALGKSLALLDLWFLIKVGLNRTQYIHTTPSSFSNTPVTNQGIRRTTGEECVWSG